MTLATVTLPIPPSTNRIWRYVPGKPPMKSRGYRSWLSEAETEIRLRKAKRIEGPVVIRIRAERPNKRRDLDNIIKPILDVLTAAGCIEDDRYVIRIEAEWMGKGDLVNVEWVEGWDGDVVKAAERCNGS